MLSAPSFKKWRYSSSTKILKNNLNGTEYSLRQYEHEDSVSGTGGFRIYHGPDLWIHDHDVNFNAEEREHQTEMDAVQREHRAKLDMEEIQRQNYRDMDGSVKWFNKDKGFGFISTSEHNDYFFHISNVRGLELPNIGDSASFNPIIGRNGKPAAIDIEITAHASNVPGRTERSYYGKPKYRTEIVTHGSSKAGSVTILGIVGAIVGGPVGAVIGTAIGAKFGENTEEVTKQVEITSPCIKCGGKGQVTSRLDGRTGFQCPTCRSFWKVSDGKLPPEDLKALQKMDF